MILGGANYLYTSFLSVYHMQISYLGVFIYVLSAYDVYEEKKTVLFTSPIILLVVPNCRERGVKLQIFGKKTSSSSFI